MTAGTAADFLVELGTEELPPKALKQLMQAFADGLDDGLADARLDHQGVVAYGGPRRLALRVAGLARAQADRDTRQKGPPVSIALGKDGKPTKAGKAFASKCGVDFAALGREATDKGEYLVYSAVEKGRPTKDLLPGIVNAALNALPIPRRMRWGDYDAEFVRPVHWLVMLHGKTCVPGSILGVDAGRQSRGHRFMATGELAIGSPDDYLEVLESQGFVIADFAARRAKIVAGVTALAGEAGGTAIGGDVLIDEVTALTEWPVPMLGSFDPSFLEMPREVIIATLTGHQRYFPVAAKNGALLPAFITVANLDSTDPDRVRHGNERVIQPRLADAAFFWRTDLRTKLGERVSALKDVVYQQGLGSMHDKCTRIAALATRLAADLDVDAAPLARAALLCKSDLLTGMVGEFPELQGVMGRYYAAADGEQEAVADAIGEHYLPRFAGDELPASIGGQLLSVADRLDTLAGIFALGKKPSGNRDPFGLRRAALGLIRVLIENSLDVDFHALVTIAVSEQRVGKGNKETDVDALADAVYEFIVDRLRRYYLDQDIGITAEMFEAVRDKRPHSLSDFDQRLKAVAVFAQLEPAASLAAANKRTANILRQAAFEDGARVDPALLQEGPEVALFEALGAARNAAAPLLAERAYTETLTVLAELRPAVDRFFDEVMVMADDEALRQNRLAMLSELRALFLDIADVSRLTPGKG